MENRPPVHRNHGLSLPECPRPRQTGRGRLYQYSSNAYRDLPRLGEDLDWSDRLGRAEGAGTFEVYLDGQRIEGKLGRGRAEWAWELAGTAVLENGDFDLVLKDLTGFNGRVDAIQFSRDPDFELSGEAGLEQRSAWNLRGGPGPVEDAGSFDLVVVGGGYGGLGTAISAARMGMKVALIQNRKVLGGNGSSEVRVWAKGDLPPSEYPLADIVLEIQDEAKASPGKAEEFVDDKKERVVRAEKNITLFLGHHTYGLEMKDGAIAAAQILEVESSHIKRVAGTFVADCTGHGFMPNGRARTSQWPTRAGWG